MTFPAERLSPDEALRLVRAAELPDLGRAAFHARRRRHPGRVVTCVFDRNVNYTNVCAVRCAFCAYCRNADAPDAFVLSREALTEKPRESTAAGGTQVMLQGGCNPDLPPVWHEDLLRFIKREFPRLHVHGFSPAELVFLAERFRAPLPEILGRFKEAGLDSLPGGGAEILCARVRRIVSPNKATTEKWLDVYRHAARLGLKGSATMVFGHVETEEERIEHLRRIRDLQDETAAETGEGVFISFILWPMQLKNTALEGRAEQAGAATYLRWLALSRLFLDNIPHLQASWVTLGTGIGQLSLLYGADDWGGLMMEENVVKEAGCVRRAGVEELRRLSAEAGFELRRRDFFYRILDE